MSIAIQIERLKNAKQDIKTAIENKGVSVGNGLLDTYANKINQIETSPELEDLTVTPTTEEQNFKSEKYGYDNVKVNAIEAEKLRITPSRDAQIFLNKLYDDVTVYPIESESLTVTPSRDTQLYDKNLYHKVTVNPIETKELWLRPKENMQLYSDDVYSPVTVMPIPDEYIIPTGSKTITENGTYDVTDKATAVVDVEGIVPTGNIHITENGTYDVTDKATATVNIESSGSQYPIYEGDGEHEVRFVDYDGTLIKVQYVNDGGSAIAPELPEHDRLTFVEWNRPYNNITHDLDVGAIYKPTSDNTELFINVTEETGLGITLNINRAVSSGTITVNWGDGTTSTFGTGTGTKSLTHNYSAYGEYMISIITTIKYRLGTASSTALLIMGSNEDRNYGLLIKCYCSDKVDVLTSYSFLNNYNLEEFTMVSVTNIREYCFSNTKLKAMIIPDTVTTFGYRVITHSKKLEYYILNDTMTGYSLPLTTHTKVKKMIYSAKSYATATSISSIATYDDYEYIWYPKSTKNYAFSSSVGIYCTKLRYIPIYDNFTGFTSTANLYGTSIEKIALPPSVTQIANQTLYNCGNLTDIYIYATTPPTLGGTSAFGSGNKLQKIHVYPECLEAYQSATNWSTSSIKNKLVGDLKGEFKDGYYQRISRN